MEMICSASDCEESGQIACNDCCPTEPLTGSKEGRKEGKVGMRKEKGQGEEEKERGRGRKEGGQ